MGLEILKMLVDAACADGKVTEQEMAHLKEKATELGLSDKDLDFLIQTQLDRVNSQPASVPVYIDEKPEVQQKLEEAVKPTMAVSQTRINLGKIEINESKTTEVEISFTGTEPLEWKATSGDKQLELKQTDNKLTITYKSGKTGKFAGKVKIESALGSQVIDVFAVTSPGVLKYVLIAGVVLLVVILGFILQNVFKSDEEMFWDKVKTENTIKAYNSYIDKFKNGKYLIEAQKTKELILNEQKVWGEALLNNNLKGYNDYLQQYPQGKFTEDATWYSARLQNKKEIYSSYLEKYPKGKFITEAQSRLDMLAAGKTTDLNVSVSNLPDADMFIEDFINDLVSEDWTTAFKKTKCKKWKTAEDLSSDAQIKSIFEVKSVSISNQDEQSASGQATLKIQDATGTEKTVKLAVSLRTYGTSWKITSFGKATMEEE
jgi:hypothetical protein